MIIPIMVFIHYQFLEQYTLGARCLSDALHHTNDLTGLPSCNRKQDVVLLSLILSHKVVKT